MCGHFTTSILHDVLEERPPQEREDRIIESQKSQPLKRSSKPLVCGEIVPVVTRTAASTSGIAKGRKSTGRSTSRARTADASPASERAERSDADVGQDHGRDQHRVRRARPAPAGRRARTRAAPRTWTATRKRNVEQARATQMSARSTGAASRPSQMPCPRARGQTRAAGRACAVNTIATHSMPVAARVPPAEPVPPRPKRNSTNAAHARRRPSPARPRGRAARAARPCGRAPERAAVHAATRPRASRTTRPSRGPSNQLRLVRRDDRSCAPARRAPRAARSRPSASSPAVGSSSSSIEGRCRSADAASASRWSIPREKLGGPVAAGGRRGPTRSSSCATRSAGTP